MAASFADREMDVRQYCETVYRELSEMKKKAFNLVCGLETTSASEEARKTEYLKLFDIVDYLERKLDSLTKDCPTDWRSVKDEIEGGRRKLDDAMEWWYG